MSRLTGKEAFGLMEAYQAVYAPQELTEEQVWEGVENWVHSLLEEGYDLSDYTWEEMYERYITELMADRPKYNPAFNVPQPKSSSNPVSDFLNAPNVRQNATNAARTGIYGRYGTQSAQVKVAPVPNFDTDQKARDRYGLPPKKSTTPTPATPAPKSTSPAPARPATTATSSSPAATAPSSKPTAAKTVTPEKKMGGDPMDQWARANPTLAAKVKPGQSGYDTIKARLSADNDRQENYDAYDLVLSHLINEGYADTQEAALAIMGNMSEDWRESIFEEVFDEARRADKLGYERGTAANPEIRNISHSDPSQRTMLNSRVRRRAEEMGRERRNSPKYKQGARPPLSAKEKLFLKFADRSSPTSGNPRNPNVQDTGSQTTWPSERRAQKDPKQNPKHNANRDNNK